VKVTNPIYHRKDSAVKATRREILIGTAAVCVGASAADAQSGSSPYKFERGYPTTVRAELAYDVSDLRRAGEAY
jgi:hypothetical protein